VGQPERGGQELGFRRYLLFTAGLGRYAIPVKVARQVSLNDALHGFDKGSPYISMPFVRNFSRTLD
jgi:hypothetical protein